MAAEGQGSGPSARAGRALQETCRSAKTPTGQTVPAGQLMTMPFLGSQLWSESPCVLVSAVQHLHTWRLRTTCRSARIQVTFKNSSQHCNLWDFLPSSRVCPSLPHCQGFWKVGLNTGGSSQGVSSPQMQGRAATLSSGGSVKAPHKVEAGSQGPKHPETLQGSQPKPPGPVSAHSLPPH